MTALEAKRAEPPLVADLKRLTLRGRRLRSVMWTR
jgi:hypothetical protein